MARRSAASSRRPPRRAPGTARCCARTSPGRRARSPPRRCSAPSARRSAVRRGPRAWASRSRRECRSRSSPARRGRCIAPSISAESRDVAGERPALVERRGEGDHPRARDRARRSASCRRRRRARRAGGSSRRCRCRSSTARGRRRRRPPSRPTNRPGPALGSHGLRTSPKAEFSFEEPIANSSMLVLPSTVAPGIEQALDRRRGIGRHVALEDLRAGSSRAGPRCRRCP